MFQVIEEGKEASIEFYNAWVDEVKNTVPKERLLVFSVKEGWEPLCKFLNVPIPEQPFPRTNDTKTIERIFKTAALQSYLLFIGLPIVSGIAAYMYRETIQKYLMTY